MLKTVGKNTLYPVVMLAVLVLSNTSAVHAGTKITLKPERYGVSAIKDEKLPLNRSPRWSTDGFVAGATKLPVYGLVGFSSQWEKRRFWTITARRTGVIFDLSIIPENADIERAQVRYVEADLADQGTLLNDDGTTCASAVKEIRMLTPDAVKQWTPAQVKKFAPTKGFDVTPWRNSTAGRSGNVTRYLQHAHYSREAYGGKLGLMLVGHKEKLSRVKQDQRCSSTILDVELLVEFADQ